MSSFNNAEQEKNAIFVGGLLNREHANEKRLSFITIQMSFIQNWQTPRYLRLPAITSEIQHQITKCNLNLECTAS